MDSPTRSMIPVMSPKSTPRGIPVNDTTYSVLKKENGHPVLRLQTQNNASNDIEVMHNNDRSSRPTRGGNWYRIQVHEVCAVGMEGNAFLEQQSTQEHPRNILSHICRLLMRSRSARHPLGFHDRQNWMNYSQRKPNGPKRTRGTP